MIWTITAAVIIAVSAVIVHVRRISVLVCADVASLNSLIVACNALVASLPDHWPRGIPPLGFVTRTSKRAFRTCNRFGRERSNANWMDFLDCKQERYLTSVCKDSPISLRGAFGNTNGDTKLPPS